VEKAKAIRGLAASVAGGTIGSSWTIFFADCLVVFTMVG